MDLTLNPLIQTAIKAALENDWTLAVNLNKKIITENPKDAEAFNRLARAYFELGKINDARKSYKQVLSVDPYNQIALRNLKRITKTTKINNHNNHAPINFQIFLSEPGKTKLVALVKVTTPNTISALSIGEKLNLVYKKHAVTVTNNQNQYIGAIPDDLAHHLISLVAGGNQYQAYVKSLKSNGLQVIICEELRSKRFVNQPSFLESGTKIYYPLLRQENTVINGESQLGNEETDGNDIETEEKETY
jgi:tetratricopeptide (TPR) repeat protein